jgi:hypothetical protein
LERSGRLATMPANSGLAIGVVRMKCREQNCPLNAGLISAPEVILQRRPGVPRTGQPVALAGVAVAVDDHGPGAGSWSTKIARLIHTLLPAYDIG